MVVVSAPVSSTINAPTIATTTSNVSATPTTPSSLDGIPPTLERLHILNGTSILSHIASILRLSASTRATSMSIFHLFYTRRSLRKFSVWSTCLGCTVLACKASDDARRIRDVVIAYVHVWRRFSMFYLYKGGTNCNGDGNDGSRSNGRRCSGMKRRRVSKGDDGSSNVTNANINCSKSNDNDNDSNKSGDGVNTCHDEQTPQGFEFRTSSIFYRRDGDDEIIDDTQKQNMLRRIPVLSPLSRCYGAWLDETVAMEGEVLRTLGFHLYCIEERHPHKFLLSFIKVLELDCDVGDSSVKSGDNACDGMEAVVGRKAWNYCNDSCRLDLCVRYPPEIMACAAIYLACLDVGIHDRLPFGANGNQDTSSTNKTMKKCISWWHVFVGPDHDKDIANVCNAVLALDCENNDGSVVGDDDGWSLQRTEAMRCFVVSLVKGNREKQTNEGRVREEEKRGRWGRSECSEYGDTYGGGSFNDPGSFLWENLLD